MKSMIEKGDSYGKIKKKNPSISEDDYREFEIKCESSASAEPSQWGEDMRDFNLGVHKLGPGSYRVAEPKWDKEEVERAEQGLPPSSINTMKSRLGTMSGPDTRWTR